MGNKWLKLVRLAHLPLILDLPLYAAKRGFCYAVGQIVSFVSISAFVCLWDLHANWWSAFAQICREVCYYSISDGSVNRAELSTQRRSGSNRELPPQPHLSLYRLQHASGSESWCSEQLFTLAWCPHTRDVTSGHYYGFIQILLWRQKYSNVHSSDFVQLANRMLCIPSWDRRWQRILGSINKARLTIFPATRGNFWCGPSSCLGLAVSNISACFVESWLRWRWIWWNRFILPKRSKKIAIE